MKRLSDELTVSPQVPLEAIPAIADAGFKTIMCNRPDQEDPGQPSFDEIRAKAEECGLETVFLPVVSGNVQEADADAFGDVLAKATKPVFAYCRTGTRCTILWSLASANSLTTSEIVSAAAKAGYDMAPLVPRIDARR
ncbi:TIGR01244 family sulfur transferase [Thalassospira marina]|uniref:TIGR01244 family phosphatase n=1 Tax=Thalassospira marina TaxID=2048283 RepID=A0A2N3KGA1_9PROT|nr:TIGR01244 family sulfur transferase [Thalassospira marina]AUG53146.1 TIGR01244 family phosphatase [Thalassospira marina]PKR49607.1 TIGR01244 family phosphatase [Thalassospira marina]